MLKAVEFFCGIGGTTNGLSRAGIVVLAGIDKDPSCKETYEYNNPDSEFICEDICDLSENQLAELIEIRRDDDSLIFVGCSPCQFWSKINTNKEKSEQSKNLLREFQRFVDWFRPGYVVIENVPGLQNKKNEQVLTGFLSFLKKAGYVCDGKVINARYYGVPQNRYRYLLIATRLTSSISLPKAGKDHTLIVENFIGVENGFAPIEAGYKDQSEFMHTAAGLSEKNLMRIRSTKKDGGDRLDWKEDPELQLKAYEGKDDYFKDVYGRMWWKKPAPTITTRFHSLSNGRFGHPEEDRAISLREGATLQTFPKTYVFKRADDKPLSETDVARHIGNAVPPELAYRVGAWIVEHWQNAVIPS